MIAIIPARGGSKGLPRKNILNFAGKPLISYTIEAAKKSKYIEEVIVTTDDEEIASVAESAGANVPFLRPSELATDTSSAVDVYIHAVEWIRANEDKDIDTFMVLLPTVPLRTSEDIDSAYELFVKEKAKTLIAVVDAPVPPGWFLLENDNKRLSMCGFGNPSLAMSNRQKSEKYVVPCGAIYILNYELLKNNRAYYCDNTIAYNIQANHAVDIDNIDDFIYAEYLFSENKNHTRRDGFSSFHSE